MGTSWRSSSSSAATALASQTRRGPGRAALAAPAIRWRNLRRRSPSPRLAKPVSAARAHARATLETIDLHCAGEPLRLIRSGFPQVPHGADPGAPALGARARRPRAPCGHVRAARPSRHVRRDPAAALPAATRTSACCSCTTRATARCAGTASSRSRPALIEEGLYPATSRRRDPLRDAGGPRDRGGERDARPMTARPRSARFASRTCRRTLPPRT